MTTPFTCPGERERDPHDMTRSDEHGHADLVTIATCACGATFDGRDEADVLAQWGRHAEEARRVSRLRSWWWRRTHRPFDWHEAFPELRQCSARSLRERLPKRAGNVTRPLTCRWCKRGIRRAVNGRWYAGGLAWCMDGPDHEHLPDRRRS